LQQHTTPYTLEQNGVFECKNWTLIEFAYNMLQLVNLWNSLWGKIVATTS
jgi:hypothetical protein